MTSSLHNRDRVFTHSYQHLHHERNTTAANFGWVLGQGSKHSK
jgi:hypothetical protein